MLASIPGIEALGPRQQPGGEVVEIALLLPAKRAEALIALSRERHQSVGQILRQLIDQALVLEER